MGGRSGKECIGCREWRDRAQRNVNWNSVDKAGEQQKGWRG